MHQDKCLIIRQFYFFCAVLLVALTGISAQAAPDKSLLEVPTKNAPALMDAAIASETSLGLWDDIYVPKDADFIVLRKDDSLFQLSIDPGSKPQKLLTNPELAHTRIVTVAARRVNTLRCGIQFIFQARTAG